jgi:hypothetical protein
MAIQHRRGNFADFDPYKMRPGEWAFPLDRGEGYYCISPGDVRRVATKEEIIEILETSQEAYDGLQQLLTELENETVATGILNDIADLILKSNKNENDIAKINDRHIGTNLISPSSDTYKNLNFSLGESYLGRIDNGLVGGKPITISTILKDTDFFYDGVALRIYFYDESDTQLDFKTGTHATEDGLYSFTAMIPTGTVYAEIYASLLMGYTVDSNTKYKCLKAELGSLATPWKPSIYDLYNEVSAHLAESANKHITESGSNENGSYIKFDDGTMIAYGNFERIFNTGTTHQELSPAMLYPATFFRTPAFHVLVVASEYSGFGGYSITTSGWRVLYRFNTAMAESNRRVVWSAIGRWK